MTSTHLSHFGLEIIGETSDNVIFDGTLANCRRMAFAHGMEVEKYEGRTISINGGRALMTPADKTDFSICWFKGGGLIIKGRDGYSLVMPQQVWKDAK